MANDTQCYTKTFSNENLNDSGYQSDYQETPKIYGKNDYPSEFFCNSCYADRQKVSAFFSKMSGVSTNFSVTLNQNMCKSHFF